MSSQSRPTVLINLITDAERIRGVERYHLGALAALARRRPPYRLKYLTASWQTYFDGLQHLPGVERLVVHPPRHRLMRGLWQVFDGGALKHQFDLLHLGNVAPVPIGLARPMTAMVFDILEFESSRSYTPLRRAIRRAMVRRIGRKAQLITTMEEPTARRIRKILGRREEEVVALGTGIESRPATQLRRWVERQPAIVFLGGLDRHKRLDLVFRALASVPNVRLRIVSGGGEAEAKLRSLAAELGLVDRIDWLGWLNDDEARNVIRESLMLVLASDREGFGLPILEALQLGTPVLISSTLPFAETWGAMGGPVFRAGDVDDLSKVMRSFLADSDRAEALCRLGPQVVTKYEWPAVAARLDNAFRAVLGLSTGVG